MGLVSELKMTHIVFSLSTGRIKGGLMIKLNYMVAFSIIRYIGIKTRKNQDQGLKETRFHRFCMICFGLFFFFSFDIVAFFIIRYIGTKIETNNQDHFLFRIKKFSQVLYHLFWCLANNFGFPWFLKLWTYFFNSW